MFHTAYDTEPCRVYNLNELSRNLLASIESNDPSCRPLIKPLIAQDVHHKDVIVKTFGLSEGTPNIPMFTHPLVLDSLLKHAGSPVHYVTSDVRDSTDVDYHGNLKIKSIVEYNANRCRAILQGKWTLGIKAGVKEMPVNNFAMRLYSRWIGETFAQKLRCDIETTMRVKAIAAFMYYSMHQSKEEVTESELLQLSMKIGGAIRVPSNYVMEVLSDQLYLKDVKEFAALLGTGALSSRMEDVNPLVIYSSLRGTWMALKNAAETVAVAIEHPPTFEALLYSAATTSALQRSALGTMVKEELRDKDALAFVERITRIIADVE
jgi:hypothetical protein